MRTVLTLFSLTLLLLCPGHACRAEGNSPPSTFQSGNPDDSQWPVLNNAELHFEEVLSLRQSQPKFDDFTNRILTNGGGWMEGEGLRWSHDWRRVQEPERLSARGRKMFWTVVVKRFEQHNRDHQHAKTRRSQIENDDALGELIDVGKATTVVRSRDVGSVDDKDEMYRLSATFLEEKLRQEKIVRK